MSHGLDRLSRELVNRYQGDVPLADRPYLMMARVLDCAEAEVIATLGRLLEDGVATRFGPSFDANRLGGAMTLAALEVPVARYDDVRHAVNAYPEVAHNYRRRHRLNMWFVVATATPAAIPAVLGGIERDTGLAVLDLPKLREFYLGLRLVVGAEGSVTTAHRARPPVTSTAVPDAVDWRLIDALQGGLPLVPDPWAAVAESAGLGEQEVLDRLAAMLAAGVIRRIGVVPNHYRLGLRANGMSVWDVADADLSELGPRVGALDFVSHCYERPRRPPRWPYNLFAMVHGTDRDEVRAKTAHIAEVLGAACQAGEVLFSAGILKKTGFRTVA